MSDHAKEPTLIEQGFSLLFAPEPTLADRERAIRVALRVLSGDASQPQAMALLLRALDPERASAAAASKLALAFVRRGDLPSATMAAWLVERAGGSADRAREGIARAFGKGSKRLADVSPAPPPLPSVPAEPAGLAELSGEALLARAKGAMEAFERADDPAPEGKLPQLPLFSALEPKALERLLASLEVRELRAGEHAIEQGSEGREAFVVVQGTLRAERAPAAGSSEAPTLLAVLGPGAIFGEMALVSSAPRAAAVIAEEPVTLLVASLEALEAHAKTEPAIGRELGSYCRSRMLANLVRTSALLRAIPAAEHDAVMALFEARTFAEGETLFSEGSEPSGLYLIASGGVRVVAADPAGGEGLVVADLGAGDVVGEISIVLRQAATATVIASFPTVALELSRDRFQEAIRSHPSVLTELYRLATTRKDELHTVVAQEALDVEDVILL